MAAGDFYFAINATFRFIRTRYGDDALIAYWRAMGRDYYAGLSKRFQQGGLGAAAAYWQDFFDREPGGDVTVSRGEGAVSIEVHDCPAIRWLRRHGRDIMPLYCEHCRHVSGAIADAAGLDFELDGGGGSCRQRFSETAGRLT